MQQLLIKQPNIVPAVYIINAYIVYLDLSMPVCESETAHMYYVCLCACMYACLLCVSLYAVSMCI